MACLDWGVTHVDNGGYDAFGPDVQPFFSVPSPHMFDYAPIEYGEAQSSSGSDVTLNCVDMDTGKRHLGSYIEGQWSGNTALERFSHNLQMVSSDNAVNYGVDDAMTVPSRDRSLNNGPNGSVFALHNMYPGKLDPAMEMERMVALARQLNISGVLRERPDAPPRPAGQSPRKPLSMPRSNASPPSHHGHGRSRNFSLPLDSSGNSGHARNPCAAWRSPSPVFINGRLNHRDGREQHQRNPYAPSGHDYNEGGNRQPVNPYADHQATGDHNPRHGNHHLHSPHRNGRGRMRGGQMNNMHHLRHNGPLSKPSPSVDFFETLNAQDAQAATVPHRQQDLAVVSTFGEAGQSAGQFNMPQGLCLGLNDEIIVADTLSHRIQIFDKKGNFKFLWGISGVKKGQLWHPRKVAFIPKTEHIVVSDRVNGCSRIQIFERTGAYINTLGNLHSLRMALNTTTAGLTVFNDQIVVVEVQPPACVILKEDGHVHHWFSLESVMVEPSDVVVIDHKFYISDFRGHYVCVFNTWGNLLQRLGASNQEGIVRFPRGLGLTPNGNLLVADTDLNRFHVSVWSADTGDLIGYHALLDMKVSHSCGIVMNQDGELITAVKKDHMVLVMRIQEGSSGYVRNVHAGLNVDAPDFQYQIADKDATVP
ncbi:uncharacterized protein LOC129582577 [Paramacrobiotus metropolitanus]|uniref:uncharacterized protein LOC129582577 n=1 Tax=Paramacrobiotus metropolitanus TaxID=2943436 RepID=UPI002445D021|nr:uncharacterized protein LOC129582577 [Paramacrobiotus metropolitanus]XP_055330081.1 uncharacterized protein LOC129582577 [Paramacrobiotus metropolitanus]XP_055330082.1 uncharacterized protein LOC129582577 [Paramacrobiotus metropolitanus]XP_055330084.1 uncharacterized protein LOC129582577 [Paramacrobiotus metropolitanus]